MADEYNIAIFYKKIPDIYCREAFFKNAWYFKDIFRKFEVFFKVIQGFFKDFDSF
jgi:hypothetical protein